MSKNWPGGIITKNQATPTGPYENSTADGVWTLEQATYWLKQGLWPTAGNIDPSAFIENLFSTYLYAGNDSTQTITNGIDMSGKGGLSILKIRNYTGESFEWFDTVRGANKMLQSAGDQAQSTVTNYLNSFNSNGITVGSNASVSGYNYVSWTFREQAKFFDVVTYTGNGTNRTIAHNLGSVPGCIIVKRTDTTGAWQVYHRSLANTEYIVLNSDSAKATGTTRWNSTTPTSTVFSVGTDATVNANGGTYVAYIFAHDAGGFGLTGTDNVISCGTFTTNGSENATVNLGYEPQWVLMKYINDAGNWQLIDNMRGWDLSNNYNVLHANDTSAESAASFGYPTATGFQVNNFGISRASIYIAIRRGPMKTPTSGTSVFVPYAYAGSGAGTYATGINQDTLFVKTTTNTAGYPWSVVDKLRGQNKVLQTNGTNAESSTTSVTNWGNASIELAARDGFTSASPWGGPYIGYFFQRAPSFFDEVCYSGNDTAGTTITHNLGVTPEFMIVKRRSNSDGWACYHSALGATKLIVLNDYQPAVTTITVWNNTAPTSSVFTLGSNSSVNGSGSTYVAYLFATCAGVSKVGSYTGTGTTQQINCGFTSGARFVLIKRTNGSGDSADGWYVWDSARGIVSGNDPYLLLNNTDAEVTNTDYIDTYSAGFEISSTAPAAINANGGSFIFLAIA